MNNRGLIHIIDKASKSYSINKFFINYLYAKVRA